MEFMELVVKTDELSSVALYNQWSVYEFRHQTELCDPIEEPPLGQNVFF